MDNLYLTDTHAHLNDERFNEDREALIDELKSKIKWVINNGYDLKSSYLANVLAERYPHLYATAGMHPHDAKDYDDNFEIKLTDMLKKPKCVALGEIGLDYHYDLSPRDIQKQVFIRQLELADKLDKPVTIHSRDAVEDTFNILKGHLKGKRGAVLHSFSQSKEMMKRYLEYNVIFSISGVVTFKNADNLRETVSYIPLDRLLIETDCPYMTPSPFRGKRNRPDYVKYVAEQIAEIKNVSYEKICEITMNNAENFFNILS